MSGVRANHESTYQPGSGKMTTWRNAETATRSQALEWICRTEKDNKAGVGGQRSGIRG